MLQLETVQHYYITLQPRFTWSEALTAATRRTEQLLMFAHSHQEASL